MLFSCGGLPCSGGEDRILRLAASIADGIPVDLNYALSGLDKTNISLDIRLRCLVRSLMCGLTSAAVRPVVACDSVHRPVSACPTASRLQIGLQISRRGSL